MTSHRAELRKQWNIEHEQEPVTAAADKEVEDPEEVLARLSEDLKKIGLEDKSEL